MMIEQFRRTAPTMNQGGKAAMADWKPQIRKLLYPVQFEEQPLDGLDRVLSMQTDPSSSAPAIEQALTSGEPLGNLLATPIEEDKARAFLQAYLERVSGN